MVTVKTYVRLLEAGTLPVWRGLALSDDDRVRAAVIGQLMCQGVIDTGAIEARYGIDFAAYFAAALVRLKAHLTDGLVSFAAGRIAVTPAGRLLLRNVAMCFDAYLKVAEPAGAQHPTLSRLI